MTTKPNAPILAVERASLARLRDAISRAQEWQKPKLDARASIINADIIDRTVGLTTGDEVTPGSVMAYEIAGLFAPARRSSSSEDEG